MIYQTKLSSRCQKDSWKPYRKVSRGNSSKQMSVECEFKGYMTGWSLVQRGGMGGSASVRIFEGPAGLWMSRTGQKDVEVAL